MDSIDKQRTPNSSYKKLAVQWLNEALCFYESLCLVDSEVLRNRQLFIYPTVGAHLKTSAFHEIYIRNRVTFYDGTNSIWTTSLSRKI